MRTVCTSQSFSTKFKSKTIGRTSDAVRNISGGFFQVKIYIFLSRSPSVSLIFYFTLIKILSWIPPACPDQKGNIFLLSNFNGYYVPYFNVGIKYLSTAHPAVLPNAGFSNATCYAASVRLKEVRGQKVKQSKCNGSVEYICCHSY